ncbi:hypothetical protein L2E82_15338 [Cichorium intybus]|uniref:Uncharacterized protein n=1 Tax=Cichorium intybus TaxID=13427 RepID=A0ACB9F1U9_CICIN|nr:hypothetical protein L2E82_15338 [Cichorium intybus]
MSSLQEHYAISNRSKILWVSDNGIPDLGGDNEEETCYSDEVNQPVLTYPGAYRKVTVELKIHHLAVNALWLCSPQSKLHDPALYRMLQGDAKGVCTTAV